MNRSASLAAIFLKSHPQRHWPDIDENLTGDRTTNIFNGSQSKVFPLTEIGEKQPLFILGLVPLPRTLHPVEFWSH